MFKPIKPLSIIDEVSYQMKKLILDGKLRPGDLFPTETELAEQLKVSRTVVRESKKSLIGMGLLEMKNKRTYVGSDIFDKALDLLNFGYQLEKGTLDELIEARRVIENETAALAAERAGEDKIAALEHYLEQQKKSIEIEDKSSFTQSDVEWHSALADASGNRILAKMVSTIRSMLSLLISLTMDVPHSDEEAYHSHMEITKAIVAHNPERARAAMNEHLNHVQGIITKKMAENKQNGLVINHKNKYNSSIS